MLGCSCLKQKVVLLKNLDGSDSSPSHQGNNRKKKKRRRRMKMAYSKSCLCLFISDLKDVAGERASEVQVTAYVGGTAATWISDKFHSS